MSGDWNSGVRWFLILQPPAPLRIRSANRRGTVVLPANPLKTRRQVEGCSGGKYEFTVDGCAVRDADAGEEQGVRDRGGADAGAGDRREHGDLFRGERGPFEPLPFRNGDRIVALREKLPIFSFDIPFNAPDYRALAERQHSFEQMAVYQNEHFELSGEGTAERIDAARASATLAPLLAVRPLLGRWFTEAEDHPGNHVAVLSYGLWQTRYGADPSILGRTVALGRVPFTVIGVMPRSFQFPMRGGRDNNTPAALWVPMAFTQTELQGWGNMYNNAVLARLKPGVTMAQAQSDAANVIEQVEKLYPKRLIQVLGSSRLGVSARPYQQELVGESRAPLLVLLVAVGLVLLIACANVANILLARASGRQKEMAIRAALGAGRGRLVRQMLSESLLLAVAAGGVGVLIAFWGMGLLLSLAPANLPHMQAIAIDGRVLAFAFVPRF